MNSSHWKEKKKEIYEKKIKVALKINSDEEFILGKTDLPYIKMIQINFLNFKDGRPFTLAKELRKNFYLEERSEPLEMFYQINSYFCLGVDLTQWK